MICDYCKKPINKKKQYGVLCMSRLPLHDECYEKAFRTERFTLKSRLFNIKNSFLGFIDKTIFWFQYHYYVIFKMKRQIK